MKVWKLVLALVVLAGLALLRPGAFDVKTGSSLLAETSPQTESERGAVAFAIGDWDALSSDTLQTSASPWSLVNAAMALEFSDGDAVAASQTKIADIYQAFGFLTPDELANWPTTLSQPVFENPLGQNVGLAQGVWPPIEITIGNMGCAACHASVTYDETGSPDINRVWLGTPNSSINLEAYVQTLFAALRDRTDDVEALETVMKAQNPEISTREILTLRYAILPRVQSAVDERSDLGQLLPHHASLPGATNGLDSLRLRLGLQDPLEKVEASTFNSIPELGGRIWRRKFLNTGSYAHPNGDHTQPTISEDLTNDFLDQHAGIIAYFTVPSMGVSDQVAEQNIDNARDVMSWLEDYDPQPFPGKIDGSLAAEGSEIYSKHCASCHGVFVDGRLTQFPNWEGDVGTDPERASLVTKELVDAVNGGPFGAYILAREVDGYTAPPLVGLWSSAPYLHNGSVPTLWHLMRPEQRPDQFEVGGHRLDLNRVGIELSPPDGYVPWSTPEVIDTTAFGLSNEGHSIGFEPLSDREKDALLEYLKTL